MGSDIQGLDSPAAARQGVDAISRLCSEVRIPTLGGYGIDRGELERVAPSMASQAIASGSPANNPRTASAEEIIALYMQAY